MGFFKRLFKRRKKYKFNKGKSYDSRYSYYGSGSYRNPIAYRKKKKASYSKAFNLKGYRSF